MLCNRGSGAGFDRSCTADTELEGASGSPSPGDRVHVGQHAVGAHEQGLEGVRQHLSEAATAGDQRPLLQR